MGGKCSRGYTEFPEAKLNCPFKSKHKANATQASQVETELTNILTTLLPEIFLFKLTELSTIASEGQVQGNEANIPWRGVACFQTFLVE
jgi:hypothetical protein